MLLLLLLLLRELCQDILEWYTLNCRFLSQELRQQLDKLLKQKISQPDMKLTVGSGASDTDAALIRAIIELITSEDTTSRVRRLNSMSLSASLRVPWVPREKASAIGAEKIHTDDVNMHRFRMVTLLHFFYN